MKIRIVLSVLTLFLISNISFSQSGWYSLNSGTTFALNDIHFTDLNTGYAVGDFNIILKTINSGQNWFPLNSGMFAFFYGAYFLTDLKGYIVGYDGRILKTTNGGFNWINQSYNTMSDLYSVQFINEDTGFVVGDFLILKTTDGGMTWIANTEFFNHFFKRVQFINNTTGFVISFYGEILKTTNCGNNWTIIKNPGNSDNIKSLFFLNSDTGYIGGYSFNYLYLKRTLDGGSNWESINTNTISTANSIQFINYYTGFIAVNGGYILKTTNAGSNWQNVSLTSGALYSIDFIDSLTGFICGSDGKLFKTTNGGNITNIYNNLEKISFFLNQNYPNPFNPTTRISFSIPSTQYTTLKIYDAFGRDVQTLVNEKLFTGGYEVEFSGNNFPSGIYFYSLKAGDFSQVKKMILIK